MTNDKPSSIQGGAGTPKTTKLGEGAGADGGRVILPTGPTPRGGTPQPPKAANR